MGFWDGSGISWTMCKQSAPHSRQITTPTPHHSFLQAACSSWRPTPTNSVKVLKAQSRQSAGRPTHTHLMVLFPGLPRWAGTRKVKPIWILLKQETVSGSGISWAICKSAHHSRQIATPAPHQSSFLQAGCPSCRPTNSVKALKELLAEQRHSKLMTVKWLRQVTDFNHQKDQMLTAMRSWTLCEVSRHGNTQWYESLMFCS